MEGGTDENDNFVQNGAGEKNDEVDAVKINGISIDKVSIVDDHVTDCINKSIADQIVERLNVKKENPCPKVKNVKRRKNKTRGSRENSILEGNGAEANCDNLKEDEDAVASRVRKPKYCWNCVNISNFTCSGCRKAKYCEEKCQWEDWESQRNWRSERAGRARRAEKSPQYHQHHNQPEAHQTTFYKGHSFSAKTCES